MNITEIPKDAEYEGYLWMSDSKEPVMGDFSKILQNITDSSNPFIVEGQLYAGKEQRSYSIKYVDGKHAVTGYNLNNIPAGWTSDLKQFIPNRLEGVTKIKFRQYWNPQPDELCADMKTLVPAAYVFVGFEYNSKEKEEK